MIYIYTYNIAIYLASSTFICVYCIHILYTLFSDDDVLRPDWGDSVTGKHPGGGLSSVGGVANGLQTHSNNVPKTLKGKLAIASDVFLDSVKKRRSEWLYVAKGVLEPLCRLSSSMTHRGASGPAEPEVQRESADHQFAESKWDWGRICKLCKLQRMPKSMVSPWFRLRFQVGWWFDSARKSRPWRSSRVQPTRSCSRKRRHRKCQDTGESAQRWTSGRCFPRLSRRPSLWVRIRSVQCSTFILKLGLCKVLL